MSPEEREALGWRVKSRRGTLCLTQEELARRVGASRKTVNQIENGVMQPNADMLKGFARTLGVSADFLLGLTDALDPVAAVERR